jgi:hypothetical protein
MLPFGLVTYIKAKHFHAPISDLSTVDGLFILLLILSSCDAWILFFSSDLYLLLCFLIFCGRGYWQPASFVHTIELVPVIAC